MKDCEMIDRCLPICTDTENSLKTNKQKTPHGASSIVTDLAEVWRLTPLKRWDVLSYVAVVENNTMWKGLHCIGQG